MDWRGIPKEYRNQIVTGDARELAKRIPDESVDLIFTDPVYDRIDDYRWLAETAVRVLRPEGALLVWSNGKWHRINATWLEDAGMIYRWDFADVNLDRSAPMNGKIIAKTNRVIWLDKHGSSKMVGYLPDGYATYSSRSTLPRLNHSWHKSPVYSGKAINAFTKIGAIILDTFCGSGTIPGMVKQTRRNYIAFEIDPETAENARERVRMTQPPLPGLVVEQGELGI